MRDINFRAWDKRQEKMFNVDVLAISKCAWDCPDHNTRGLSLAYQPDTPVMQFTGLQDRNGKDIYEGDIVKSLMTGAEYLIFWHEENCCFRKQCVNANKKDIDIWQDNSAVYVSGNSFETPELLEQS